MAFNVTGIANYAPQNPKAFVSATIFKDRFLNLVKEKGIVMTGVKTTDKILIGTGAVNFQTGNNCTWAPSGDFNLTDKTVTVGSVKVQEEICPQDLIPKYTQLMMQSGSDNFEDDVVNEMYLSEKQNQIGRAIAIGLWQGDIASGNANLNKWDGLIKLIDAATDEVLSNTGGITIATGITPTNVIGIFDGVYAAIPTQLLDREDLVITCGLDVFRTYRMALKNANMFNYVPSEDPYEMYLPGTNVKIVATHGLNGTSRIFAICLGNICVAMDGENEFEKAELKYDESTLKNRLAVYFKLGTNVVFTSEVVSFKLI